MQSNSPQVHITKGEDLEFGQVVKGNFARPEITLEAENAAWVKITAPRYEELEIILELPEELTLAQHQIPVSIQASYANSNTATLKTAKESAIEFPAGYATFHIPVSVRKNIDAQYQSRTSIASNPNATSDVYLFFHGSAGPASVNIPSGLYSGNIFISVSLRNP